jgi:hypothetical protein
MTVSRTRPARFDFPPRLFGRTRKLRIRRPPAVTQDINVLALVKGEERYIFLFDDANRSEALRTLGRYASNPELSFSWYDAAVLSQKIRATAPKTTSDRFDLPITKELGLDDAA